MARSFLHDTRSAAYAYYAHKLAQAEAALQAAPRGTTGASAPRTPLPRALLVPAR